MNRFFDGSSSSRLLVVKSLFTASRAARLAMVVAAALLVAGLGTLVAVTRPHPRDTTALANQRPSKLPGAAVPTVPVVTGSDGRAITCPYGTVPEVNITDAAFSPSLTNGVLIGVGTYRITLRGQLVNETSAPISVKTVDLLVNGAAWSAKVTAADSVPANGATSFLAEGTYHSGHEGTVTINTEVDWQWRAESLRPCGHRGLIHEH
jgi:hypothetical protein